MIFVLLSSFCYSILNEKLNLNKYKSSTRKISNYVEPEDLVGTEAKGNYADNQYVTNHRIPTSQFTYVSPGDQTGHPLNYAFDDNIKTFWASNVVTTETTKNEIPFTFTSLTCIEAILYSPAYSTNNSANPKTRRYDGFPLILKVYSSYDEQPYQLRYTFYCSPKSTDVWNKVQFVFTEPIWCEKLKIEFVEVTLDVAFGNDYTPACQQIDFISPPVDYTKGTIAQATGNFNNNNYINQNKIATSSFTYFTQGDRNGYPSTNLFDGSTSNYWVSKELNTKTFKNYITINFNSLTCLEAILYNMAYGTNRSATPITRKYHGIPYVLKIYTSTDNAPFKLSHVFTGGPRPTDMWDRLQFVFETPIWCDKLKIEFTEITFEDHFSHEYKVACGELFLISATNAVPTVIPDPSSTPDFINAITIEKSGNYADSNYVNQHKIQTSSYSFVTSGDRSDKPASNMNENAYWVSANPNTDTFKNYIIINFNSLTFIEAILYGLAYSTNRSVTPNTRRYDGYPRVLNIYSASNGDPFKLKYVFSGTPEPTDMWDMIQFVFNEPFWCSSLKLEFVDITVDESFSKVLTPVCRQLTLISGTPVASASPSLAATPSQSPSKSPTPSQSPSQSPMATQSPSQSPTPARTAHSGSSDTYINKNFEGSIPVSDNNQIQLGGTNEIKQISGCRFTNLDITNRQFFIRVTGDSSIFDNTFEYTTYTTGKTGCIWFNANLPNKFIISNCKFIRVSGQNNDASVLNVNALNAYSQIVFRDCEFIDCGERGNDRPCVNILQKQSTIEFYNCQFTYEDPRISRVLELSGNGATFDNCEFNNCGRNSIDIGIEDIGDNTHRVFTFTNNHIQSTNTRFINAPRIKSIPIIQGNTFEDCTLNGEYFIYISHDQETIEFNNNTFNNIKSQGSSNGNCGGLSSFVERSGSKFKLIYNECHFINIINEHSTHPLNQGGALQYFSTSNYEVDIELKKCEFKSNKATHHGGAVSIQTTGDVLIAECQFEMNEANYQPTTSKLLFNNYYDQKTNGYGGAIYLNPTFNNNNEDYFMKSVIIRDCTFTNNRAYQGYAIYIEGEESSTSFSITNNNFNNNEGNAGSTNNKGIIATEVVTITKEMIEPMNTFTNPSDSDIENFVHVDHQGNRLPDATQTPTASVSQSPTPARTAHSGSSDTYINKNFDGSIPVSDSNQIQLGGTNEIKQISGCRFTNLDITNRQFFIKVTGDSSIFDNTFEYTTYTTGKTGCIWFNANLPNKFIISNCKFIRVSGQNNDASVLNVNALNAYSQIVFRDCEFIDCGERGNDRPCVNILQKQSTIEFYNCQFTYEDPRISRVLELSGNGATFDNCEFNNCGRNSIDIGIEDIGDNTHRVFTFTNNHIQSTNTRFINAPRIKSIPIIRDNVFENCRLTDEYFIYILHNQDSIEFNSNTFTNFVSTGTTEGRCGGLSVFVERNDSKFRLIYNKCQFENIVNEHSSHPFNQGGVIQYFSENNHEVDIEVNQCIFKMNKASHHGGAVSIRTSGNVLINQCTFESNEANFGQTTSKLLYSDFYELKTNGYGGAIYLNPTFTIDGQDYTSKQITISQCSFVQNKAYQGYAIYIEGEESTTVYSITENNFDNNHESSGSPDNNGIIASEVLTLTKEIIEGSNTYNNTKNAEKFMRVDHRGKLLVEGDFSYDDKNISLIQPDERIEKEVHISSVDDVSVKVTVSASQISSKSNDDGGAIHIVNCALECTGTKFNECVSPKGGGGAIYIENTGGTSNNAELVGLTFTECEAEYGGAVYIYSDKVQNPVKISFCTFVGNKATATSSDSSSKLVGGGAVFITAKKGDLSSNIFQDNEGEGGALRIYNKFNKNTATKSRLLANNDANLLIHDCTFEIGKKSDCCIFYLRGNNGANVELQKCSFNGVLPKGSHYIDGNTLSKDGPKLLVKKCKFSDSIKSLNLKDYMSIDLNDQSFLFNENSIKESKKLSLTTVLIIAAACIVALAAVIGLTVFIMKRKNPNKIQENEMSTEIRDLLLDQESNNDSVVNSSLI